jgi:hypothetical protein
MSASAWIPKAARTARNSSHLLVLDPIVKILEGIALA